MIGFYPHRVHMASETEGRAAVHIPMVYEHVASPRWEYRVLTVNPDEEPLPGEGTLNTFGEDGWIMAGLLDERMSDKGKVIHYYFVRQAA